MKSAIQSFFTRRPLVSTIGIAIASFILGWYVFFVHTYGIFTDSPFNYAPTRLSQNMYSLINPLLLCNIDRANSTVDSTLKATVTSFIKEKISRNEASDMSVYIQNYKDGTWVGVGENVQYDPASLLKVPLMIAYYQIAEKTPEILKEKTSFIGDDQNTDEFFRSSQNIQPHVSYTIDELIQSMIINSDNTAMTLLSKYVDQDSLFTVYTDLGLPTPPNDPTVEYLSAKSYAYFFRILYNATYLTKEDSQKALDLLSQAHLPNGIASAVPDGVIVADKFGERTVYDENHRVIKRELHECGIVYKAHAPYLLCIMSRGSDFKQLAQNIHDLSGVVYKNIK